MILHCTKRLAAKLPEEMFRDTAAMPPGAKPSRFGEWHGHLLILDRRRCLLFCHDITRYVMFLPGLRKPQFADLGRWHRELFLATLAAEDVPAIHLTRLEVTLGPLRTDTRTDRSVLGSLRVAADDLQYGYLPRVAHVLDLDPVTTSRQLNERPCTVGNRMIWPAQAMLRLINEEMQMITNS